MIRNDNTLYGRGLTALDDHHYAQALDDFTEVVSRGGPKADGALYWKAYTLNKLGRRDDATAAIAQLRTSYATSHWLEDAKALAMHLPADKHPIHDESNCDMHAQLHLALYFTRWVPLLVCAGLFIAFLTQLPVPLIRRHVPVRVDCRGPPARRGSF